MLHRPFLESMNTSLNGDKNCLSEMFSTSTLFSEVLRGNMEKDVINKIVFPFLFAIGLLQSVFFGYHMFYVFSALTTLEYKIILNRRFEQLARNSLSSCIIPHNPFDRGWAQNFKNALGPFFLIFLPIQVDPEEIKAVLITNVKKKN
mmetsp:Transcript_10481/g.25304  ORF Transcript_10481/g.25304 Transcript_10481/m.25304 type:complete len:147 (+) Transcript_10481:174-614(+)